MARYRLSNKEKDRGLPLSKKSDARTCAFCDKAETDRIPMHDLNLQFRKELPKDIQKLYKLPICETHFNKYVIRPQIKENMKVIRRINNNQNNNSNKKKLKNK